MGNVHDVRAWVHDAYWRQDLNCAVTTLHALGRAFDIPIERQVFDAALGMHGAGGYRAQCGLVEGGLMFIGLLGRARGLEDAKTVEMCWDYADAFEDRFGSLLCRELRPEGFEPDNPPHLCEDLTQRAILSAIDFLEEELQRVRGSEHAVTFMSNSRPGGSTDAHVAPDPER
jgi:hypothetical protein